MNAEGNREGRQRKASRMTIAETIRFTTERTKGTPEGAAFQLSPRERAFIEAYRRYERAVRADVDFDRMLELAKAAAETLNTRMGDRLAAGVFWSARVAATQVPGFLSSALRRKPQR